jgi:hypothetical protein
MTKNDTLLLLFTEGALSSPRTGGAICSAALGESLGFVKVFAISCSEVFFGTGAEGAVAVAGGAWFFFFATFGAPVWVEGFLILKPYSLKPGRGGLALVLRAILRNWATKFRRCCDLK